MLIKSDGHCSPFTRLRQNGELKTIPPSEQHQHKIIWRILPGARSSAAFGFLRPMISTPAMLQSELSPRTAAAIAR
jgi:hypothetical protein